MRDCEAVAWGGTPPAPSAKLAVYPAGLQTHPQLPPPASVAARSTSPTSHQVFPLVSPTRDPPLSHRSTWHLGLVAPPLPPAMSVTAAERANPPPRRKSCAACTRAKRRCDLAWPTCQRCAGRGLTCDYPQRRGPVSTSVSLSPAPAVSAAPDFSIDALMDDFWNSEACAVDPLPLPDFAAPALEMQREIPDKAALPVPPGPFSATLLRGDDQKQLVRLGPCEADGTAKSAEGVPCSLQFINERLEYLFEKLPETPRELVETLGTAWCHPCVFKDVRPKVYDGNLLTLPYGLIATWR